MPAHDVLGLIIGSLVARGWAADRLVKNTVTKMFITVVAPKQADIWVAHSRESDRYVLTGQYESQGNNALSTCWAWIPATAGKDKIAEAVDDYLTRVDHAISQTYAVRLLKHCTLRPGLSHQRTPVSDYAYRAARSFLPCLNSPASSRSRGIVSSVRTDQRLEPDEPSASPAAQNVPYCEKDNA